jgi:alanine racemase
VENEIEMNRPTWVEVDLEAIKNNFLRIQEKVSSKSVICVVKADAYGLGASKIASTLEEVGASAFAVASMEEALSLRDSQIKKPILVLGYVDTRNLHLASLNEIRITLFDKDFLKRINDYKNETPLKIHVKIDTGMHRLGISLTELPSVFEELNKIKNVIVEGIYTHFASADSDPEYTRFQINQFNEAIKYLKDRNMLPKIVHAANSAALLNFEEAHYSAVRPGILLYGISPNPQTLQLGTDFREALAIKTRIVKVTQYGKGERISYGGTYKTEKESLIATIPIGYADCVPRNLSNRGYVLVKGLKAPIVGNITMDMMMIDVTGFPYIHPGNEVVIVGSQGQNRITLEEFASLSKTIPYEILTRLNKRIKRIYK